jgi:fructan beta-fructosidase
MTQEYNEFHRPQFHFSPRVGWTNDPNGMVYHEGEYHLFFQHNPKGINWGNMTWGHAVSPDMLHWEQLDHAIYPDELGTIFSGSAVVDHDNTAGFNDSDNKAIIVIYTSAGEGDVPFTQSIAYSTDRGRSWTKYADNPVLGHIASANRDPKVIWHGESKQWVMALYLEGCEYAIYGSPDLKSWKQLSLLHLPDASECPDIFPLAVDGDSANVKWVFWGGSSSYVVGSFDGAAFTAETEPRRAELGPQGYAAQTFSDIPDEDGRRIQISWLNGGSYPGMPFNQQMTIPVELTLRSGIGGPRMFRQPIREIESLRGGPVQEWSDLTLADGESIDADTAHDLLEICVEIDVPDGPRPLADGASASSVVLNIRGSMELVYDAVSKQIKIKDKTVSLPPVDGVAKLQVLVDRTSVEVFGNDGAVSITYGFLPGSYDNVLSIAGGRGGVGLKKLSVAELKSTWGS